MYNNEDAWAELAGEFALDTVLKVRIHKVRLIHLETVIIQTLTV